MMGFVLQPILQRGLENILFDKGKTKYNTSPFGGKGNGS